ncbi:MAG: nucleotide exchange factor GrpE [Thermodesulfovibrionia bacterium]
MVMNDEEIKRGEDSEMPIEVKEEIVPEESQAKKDEVEGLKKELSELNDKYLRLYAEFENYKRFEARRREELLSYSNEGLIRELLSVIDHLELALQHASNSEAGSALTEGVELTLRELKTILERYGLVSIDAIGKQFDPYLHDAMSQVETDEVDENVVVTEFRKGYKLKDRVLRASLVGVSKKPSKKEESEYREEGEMQWEG